MPAETARAVSSSDGCDAFVKYPKNKEARRGRRGGEEDEALPPEPLRAAKTGEYGTQCQSPEGPGTVVGPVFNFFLDRGE